MLLVGLLMLSAANTARAEFTLSPAPKQFQDFQQLVNEGIVSAGSNPYQLIVRWNYSDKIKFFGTLPPLTNIERGEYRTNSNWTRYLNLLSFGSYTLYIHNVIYGRSGALVRVRVNMGSLDYRLSEEMISELKNGAHVEAEVEFISPANRDEKEFDAEILILLKKINGKEVK